MALTLRDITKGCDGLQSSCAHLSVSQLLNYHVHAKSHCLPDVFCACDRLQQRLRGPPLLLLPPKGPLLPLRQIQLQPDQPTPSPVDSHHAPTPAGATGSPISESFLGRGHIRLTAGCFLPPPQSKSSAPLCSMDEGVQRLALLWERTQLKGAHSFLLAMTQHVTPQRKVVLTLR